jgi:signal peptidase I
MLIVGGVVIVAAIAIAAAVILATSGGGGEGGAAETRTFTIPSGSMEPTLKVGEKVTVNLDAYADSEPAIGDLVALRAPAGAESASECGVLLHGMQPLELGEACPKPTAAVSNQVFVKRVVAVGGDTLSIKEGQAVVNGEEMNESAFTSPCGGGYECNLPRTITIPPGYFFTLGDNRGESDDSRYWGPVPAASIVGRVEG